MKEEVLIKRKKAEYEARTNVICTWIPTYGARARRARPLETGFVGESMLRYLITDTEVL